MNRKIIHCDADCFYAAIEMRDNPELRGIPLAVGGRSDRRGVISTCNYEARRFGVRSAMASAKARALCPNLVIVPPQIDKYKAASQIMREIFLQFTDLVEPLSLDEAYLDVTASDKMQSSATRIAEEIRRIIHKRLDITVSAGVSNSKFLAKIASDWNKPDGLFVIPPERVDAFVLQLPVNKIHGVGKVTAAKLQQMNILTCADLRVFSVADLEGKFGRFGQRLYELARGIDSRQVATSRERKSLSVERTFASDLSGVERCLQQIPELLAEFERRIGRLNCPPNISKAFVKVKFSDFTATTLERTGTKPSLPVYRELMTDALTRNPLPVRLLGLGVRLSSHGADDSAPQLELFANY